MPKFTLEFGTEGLPPADSDGRLDAPAFHRNHEAIWSVLSGFLDGKSGSVLELGSGTGQHIVDYARRSPNLTWWPSDVIASHLASIAAYQRAANLANLRQPQSIDLMYSAWFGESGVSRLTAVLSINVLHIAPWRVAENLIAGAGHLLREGGNLFLYGPYKRDGAHTAPSNEAFDASLRARNPDWGVRDVDDISDLAQANGLTRLQVFDMPANNLVLAFERRQRPH